MKLALLLCWLVPAPPVQAAAMVLLIWHLWRTA